jgi:hypothetical protein
MIHGDNAKTTTQKEYLQFIFTKGSDQERSEILRQFGENMVLKDRLPQIVK